MLVLLLLATEREREQFNYMHTSIMTTKQFKALYSTCSAAWTEDLHLDMWFPKVLECGFVPASMTSPHPSQALPHFHINTCSIMHLYTRLAPFMHRAPETSVIIIIIHLSAKQHLFLFPR